MRTSAQLAFERKHFDSFALVVSPFLEGTTLQQPKVFQSKDAEVLWYRGTKEFYREIATDVLVKKGIPASPSVVDGFANIIRAGYRVHLVECPVENDFVKQGSFTYFLEKINN